MTEESNEKFRNYKAKVLGGYRALDTFTQEKFRETPETRQALAAMLNFNRAFDNFFLWGPTGTGKSHLGTIAARKYILKPEELLVIKQMKIARDMRATENAEAEQRVLDSYVFKPILFVDDLGVGKDTEFSLSTLYEIIDGRYMNMKGGLIVTSNLSLQELALKIGDERISSRLAQMCRVFNLSGVKDSRVGGQK